ncbi:c-type cytochrome [Mucilaginibacter frigoritolerans]|nr:c-type cytochrome [Mucilaginibacter frigoritolerans]
MKINKKFAVIISLSAMALAGVAAAKPGFKDEPEQYKNLKVLPKNISSKDLNGIMVDDFQDGLGVTCNFCHASAKDGHGLDFVSDAKPEKEISRVMMRMTIALNKKYLKVKHPLIGSNALVVTCNTCHKGEAFPEGSEPK